MASGEFFTPPKIVDEEIDTNADWAMADTSLRPDYPFSDFVNDNWPSSPAAGNASTLATDSAVKAQSSPLNFFGSPALPQQPASIQPRAPPVSSSPESSAQDSSSDTSAGRKRSISALDTGDQFTMDTMDPSALDYNSFFNSAATVNPTQLESDMDSLNQTMSQDLGVSSAASSPGFSGPGSYNSKSRRQKTGHNFNGSNDFKVSAGRGRNDAEFFISESREDSPMSAMSGTMTAAGQAPHFAIPVSQTPSPDVMGAMSRGSDWSNSLPLQNNQWPMSLGAGPNSSYPPMMGTGLFGTMTSPQYPAPSGPQLYVWEHDHKSRVETQITLKLTLCPPADGVTRLHLPARTVAKPKHLSKVEEKRPDTLELDTYLVCASAMLKPDVKKRVLERAASNRAELPASESPDSNDTSNSRRSSAAGTADGEDSDNPDKPQNGGEVRICNNCINRERKRLARKQKKSKEDETLFNSYERERVVVFNANEYQEFKEPEAPKDGEQEFPKSAMQVKIPMRITCYCRHQGEKLGFQVIFTIKDHLGNVVAQEMTRPIIITDDHKTHNNPALTASASFEDAGLVMPDTAFMAEPQQVQGSFAATRAYHSTTDLQELRQNFLPQNFSRQHHGLPHNGLSRHASPTPQTGPNKRRKNSSIHRRLPDSMAMTRLDTAPTSMPGTSTVAPSTISSNPVSPGFSSMNAAFMSPTEQSMNMNSIGMGATSAGPSPGPFTAQPRSGGPENAYQQFYSVPNSAHPSRAPSPVSSSRPMNAFQRSANMSHALNNRLNNLADNQWGQAQQEPYVQKVLPGEGPKAGGIEVTCLGQGFRAGMEIYFGGNPAKVEHVWASSCVVVTLPPSAQAGPVPVTLRLPSQSGFSPPYSSSPTFFKYLDEDDHGVMELALRLLCHKATGNPSSYKNWAHQIVSGAGVGTFPTSGGSSSGMQQGRQVAAMNTALFGDTDTEESLLNCLERIDLDDSPYRARFNIRAKNGATLLHYGCSLGYNRFVAGLLARGANPDVRDKSGYTPLMLASMHGHSQIVKRLILKGADPMVRNATGRSAADLAPSEETLAAFQRVTYHRRNRSTTSNRSRASSGASLQSGWEPPSPARFTEFSTPAISFEDDEDDDSEDEDEDDDPVPVSRSGWTSRRNSTALRPKDVRGLTAAPVQQNGLLSPAAAMTAWRDQLAAQIQHFHQSVVNFQMPALPPIPAMPNLEDYQAHPMVRRISSLVPHRSPSRNDSTATITPASAAAASNSSTTPTSNERSDYSWRDLFSTPALPPAYEEIYPEKRANDTDVKKSSALQASMEAVLDQKCAEAFDNTQVAPAVAGPSQEPLEVKITKKLTKAQQEQLRLAHAQKVKRIRSDRNLFFIWIPLLLIIVLAMLHNSYPGLFSSIMPYTAPIKNTFTGFVERAHERIVELA